MILDADPFAPLRAPRRSPQPAHRFDPAKRGEDYPEPYPTGWYRLCGSADLDQGEPIAVDALGKHLVVFRGDQSNAAVVLDAHCPHQGASLAAGGKIREDCIECPFHSWRFDSSGALVNIPGLEKLPRVRLRRYPVVERYGQVWTFHHVDDDGCGDAKAPLYEFENIPDIDSGDLVYRGEYAPGELAMHIVEFAENSVDFQHFAVVHGEMLIPWTQRTIPFIKVMHDPDWQPDDEHPHIARFSDNAVLEIMGRRVDRTRARAVITFYGPGSVVHFRFTIPDVGEIVMFQTHTPLAPLLQDVHFRWYAKGNIPNALVSYVIGSWISQWQQDIFLWENKVYRKKPVLVRVDGPVRKMRRWYEQFVTPSARVT